MLRSSTEKILVLKTCQHTRKILSTLEYQKNFKMAYSSVPKHLNFITGNKNKLAEVQAILEGVIELRNENVDLVEIQGTVEEVTKDKARRAAEAVSFVFTTSRLVLD